MTKLTDFTPRDEANALTALAFRNGYLEELHAGTHHAALDDPSVSRITDDEMKKLMIEASETLERLLYMRENDTEEYLKTLKLGSRYTRNWVRD